MPFGLDPKVLSFVLLGLILLGVIGSAIYSWRQTRTDADGRSYRGRGGINFPGFAEIANRHPDWEFRQIDVVLECRGAGRKESYLLFRQSSWECSWRVEEQPEPAHVEFSIGIMFKERHETDAEIQAILERRTRKGWKVLQEHSEVIVTAVG